MSKKRPSLNETFEQSPLFGAESKLIGPIIETHCHFDMIKNEEISDVHQKCLSMGVEKIITIATSFKNFETVKEYSRDFSSVYFSLGTHPHQAKEFTVEHLDFIRKETSNTQFVAVGEIGLDFYYDFSPRETQIDVFKQHLELAIELDMPVIIHTRDADQEMGDILQAFGPRMKKKGVVHSFSSGLELAQLAIDQGFYLGFNGMVTFKNAEKVRQAVQLTPIDKILIETDSPFLTPTPFRGQENTPTYLPLVAEKIIELKGMSSKIKDALQQFYQNSHSCFQLK